VNVRLSLILLTPLLISGCSVFGSWKTVEPITIQKKAEERQKLNLPDPTPLKPRVPSWIIITPENAAQVWKHLLEEKVDLVLFGLTDEGYEELAINMADLRNFINTQRQIIQQYKKYYEPKEIK